MKKRVFNLLLILTISIGLILPHNISSMADLIMSSHPLAQNNDISFGTNPVMLTSSPASTFTLQADYTHKLLTTLSFLYDVEGAWRHEFECNFNNGELLETDSAEGSVTNVNGALVMKAPSGTNNWMQTLPLAEDVKNFDMSFDISYTHPWATCTIRTRNSTLFLRIKEYSAAGDSEKFVEIEDRLNGNSVFSNINLTGKNVRFRAVEDSVQVYANSELIIDYTYPEGKTIPSGAILIGNNDTSITYDNLIIKTLPENAVDTYYKLDVGYKSTLYRCSNDSSEVIAEGSGLTIGKEYTLTLKRKLGNVELLANGNTLLTANIDLSENSAMEYGYIGIQSSSANNSVQNVNVYNSTSLNHLENCVEILPIQTQVSTSLSVLDESDQGEGAYVSFEEDDTVIVSSLPAAQPVNQWMTTTGFIDNPSSDIYIKFDVSNSRTDWTYDRFYFAGYTIYCGIRNDITTSQCTAIGPDGENIPCNDEYGYFCRSTYTMEFLREGDYVAVYYYPVGNEPSLLFEDYNCEQYLTNFSLRKQQGRLTFSNFKVYDCHIDNVLSPTGIETDSQYVKIGDYIGRVPFGTTVASFKENMISGEVISLYKNGYPLKDSDIVTTGTTLKYKGYAFEWEIVVIGDINGDANIDLADICLAENYLDISSPQTPYLLGGDTDFDNIITTNDIENLRKAALGGQGILYTQPQPTPEIVSTGSDRIICQGGEVIETDISLRNISQNYRNINSMQVSVSWNNNNSQYIENSFKEFVLPQNTEIRILNTPGKFGILYEAKDQDATFELTRDTLFSLGFSVNSDISGVASDFKITKLIVILKDGSPITVIGGEKTGFDILKEGVNKAEKSQSPVIVHKTENTFTVFDKIDYEYSLDGTDWTNVPRFKNLETGVEYKVYQRIASNSIHYAGEASDPILVTLYLQGDVNNDSRRSAMDLSIMRQYLIQNPVEIDPFAADVNLDDGIDARDLVRLKRLLADPDFKYDTSLRDTEIIID